MSEFYIRKDFDCGQYMNAWSVFVVRPNGSHIAELQFDPEDHKKAQAIADAMNKEIKQLMEKINGTQ